LSVSSAQTPTFTSRTDVVLVDALVTDGRTPVAGLGRDDFELRDNGVPQTIALLSQGQVPLGVVLAMDTSGSVKGERLSALQTAAGSVATRLQPADRLAVVTFGSRVRWRQLSSITAQAVADALRPGPDPGDTSLFDAAYTALTLAESPGTRGLAIVLTDGIDTSSILPAASVLETSRSCPICRTQRADGRSAWNRSEVSAPRSDRSSRNFDPAISSAIHRPA
jgi:VWFA-related protein